jgi:hypothetical protein
MIVLDHKLLTCGNPTLSNEQNEPRLLKYIKRSERFIVVCEYHIGGVIVPATSV